MLPNIGNKQSLSEQAYTVIKEAILNNKIKPKDILLEESLAASLGISRTPLRAALKKLEFEKLIYINSSRQAVVSEIKTEDMLQVFVFRLAVEPFVARLACDRMTAEGVGRLERNLLRQEKAINQHNLMEVIASELEFDGILAEIAGNEFFADAVGMVNTVMQRFLILSMTLSRDAPEALVEHTAMLDALKSGDCGSAARHSHDHLLKVANRLGFQPLPLCGGSLA